MRGWPLIKLLPQKTNFKFVKYSPYAGILSVILCVASIVGCFWPGLNMGIDFRGGASMEVSKPAGQVIQLDQVRSAVGELDLGEIGVQGIARRDTNVDDGSTAILRFQVPEGRDQTQVVQQVEAAITQAVGEVNYSGVSVVGSKVSGELFTSGLLALGLAIVLMFLYIWFRFEPQFGFGAVAGLVHDMVLTFGLIVLFKLEFSLNMVAAILTVIGYSMNDTVVVFDRLRENLRKYKSMPLREVIDLSLNETLSRTIITGVTAVGVLAVLAIWGGEALFGFSIALMLGIIIGTYSSIYVGAPIILLWGVKRGQVEDDAKPIKLGMASRPYGPMAELDLDGQVRAADPDRWLASRFVSDPGLRDDLIALYAFEAELMAIPTRAAQPMLAEMRYVWWSEQMDGVFADRPRVGHPVLEALTAAVAGHALPRAPFDALIEAHIGRVHGEPHDLDAFYVGPMQTAVRILAGPGHDDRVTPAARVRGLSQTGRFDEARALRSEANRALKGLPPAAFPAVAPAALRDPAQGEGAKRLRLIWAHLTGRI